ncbi:sulfurtransferase TusA family protein [Paracoccus onubensis]|uniref:Sulfurtransferase TusA family protein n=1 Tax=Paracoccus onubensis TaxID=1675788 RepID=A0A418SPU1_9RHOB|nr:sulfurtransferase TusA family protein [Paracoccus onubensis]RJE82953.1 sulfurtransferase TusA family protein [Paracoccus onubensis]
MCENDLVDARGLLCPLPVLRLRKRLLPLPQGARLRLIATDPAAIIDVPHFCAEGGHRLLATRELGEGAREYTIEKGAICSLGR